MYFRCFLKPLFHNGLLIEAHGQNSLLRFSRTTSQLLGFSARDMSGTRLNRMHFERSTGIAIDARMSNHDLGVSDLLERAYFIFFVVHLWPLIIALDLHRSEPTTGLDSTNALQGWGNDAKAIDLTGTNGWAVVANELDKALKECERLEGEDAASTNARELSARARMVWMKEPTWLLHCFISQRMRADWANRDKNVSIHSSVTFSSKEEKLTCCHLVGQSFYGCCTQHVGVVADLGIVT